MKKVAASDIPKFSRSIFWDCHDGSINFDTQKKFVIERVFTRGTEEDEKTAFRYYGEEIIKREAVEIKYLDKKTLNYLSVVLKIPKENFRCYSKTLSGDPFGMF
jgi:hypothetical protein